MEAFEMNEVCNENKTNKEKNAEMNDEKSAEINEETNDNVLLFNLALTTRTWKLRWRTSTLTSLVLLPTSRRRTETGI